MRKWWKIRKRKRKYCIMVGINGEKNWVTKDLYELVKKTKTVNHINYNKLCMGICQEGD